MQTRKNIYYLININSKEALFFNILLRDTDEFFLSLPLYSTVHRRHRQNIHSLVHKMFFSQNFEKNDNTIINNLHQKTFSILQIRHLLIGGRTDI